MSDSEMQMGQRVVAGACIGLLAIVILMGCSAASSGPQLNRVPTIKSAHIAPNPLTLEGQVSAHVDVEDLDGDSVKLRFVWFVNDAPVPGEAGPHLSPAVLKRGDRVQVEVWPHDGKVEGASLRSDRVVVMNSPPTVSRVSLEFDFKQSAPHLHATAQASDIDGDIVYLSYRWWKNGTVWKEGGDDMVEARELTSKDVVMVEVTPRDQSVNGKVLRSDPLAMVNRPPVITSSPTTMGNQGSFEYHVKAVDPDGDRLQYVLESAPSGMSIDKELGVITWSAAPPQPGIHHVRIVADDGHGGTTFQEFDITIGNAQSNKPLGT